MKKFIIGIVALFLLFVILAAGGSIIGSTNWKDTLSWTFSIVILCLLEVKLFDECEG